MNTQARTSGIDRCAIGDEAVYLRIRQLQLGLLQFTDATTAERLLTEFGSDIRYIAPWKKWIVWNGGYWETDCGGAMVHTKGLEIVRGIYSEIYKTADYRERMEIEKYAVKCESTRSRENFVRGARYLLKLNASVNDLIQPPPRKASVNTWKSSAVNGTPNTP